MMDNFDLHIMIHHSDNEQQNWIIQDHEKSVQYYLKRYDDFLLFTCKLSLNILNSNFEYKLAIQESYERFNEINFFFYLNNIDNVI